jgi:uncharacterized membrane protein YczE
MMKTKMKLKLNMRMKYRLVAALTGILSIGSALGILQALKMGSDPFNVLVSGLNQVIPFSFGTLFFLVSALMLAATLRFGRKNLGVVTVISLCFMGYMAEAVCALAAPLSALPAAAKIAIVVLSLTLECFGVAACIVSALGVAPYDAVYIVWSEHSRFSLKTCRIVLDLACVGGGLLMGGVGGVATALAILFMGPLIEFFARSLRPLVLRNAAIAQKTHEELLEKNL